MRNGELFFQEAGGLVFFLTGCLLVRSLPNVPGCEVMALRRAMCMPLPGGPTLHAVFLEPLRASCQRLPQA